MTLNNVMHPLIQVIVGLLAAVTGAASFVMYLIADRIRFDPENFKVHRNGSILLGVASLFFFVLLYLNT